MRHYGISIDPGMSTGVVLFSWGGEQDEYFKQEEVWQFDGGARMLTVFLETRLVAHPGDAPMFYGKRIDRMVSIERIVMEKFTPRGGPGFSLTQASSEPLRCEGVMIGRGLETYIDWQEPSVQYFMGGADLRDRKKRSREFLKLHGIYLTGKAVDKKDADDAISAELHAIAWLRRKRHMPTLVEFFFSEEEQA